MTAAAPGRDMRICVDGRLLDDGGVGTGVAQYARTLIAALETAGRRPLILRDGGDAARRSRPAKLLAAARPWRRTAAASGDGFLARDLFREAQVFFDLHRRPLPLALPGPAGVMHWSYPLPLRAIGWRNLYTVHDVLPLDPAIPSPVDGARLRRLLRALHAGDGTFVTVSAAARRQIVDRLGWSEAAVACCHQAADVTGADRGDLPAGLIEGGYLLYVGAVEARKNLLRLLDGYRSSGITTPLVISGPDGLDARAIDARIAATPGAIRLRLQPRATVLRLIAGARALMLVSLSEGFGLPVVEAMALGTAVLAADVPALAEVAGGAALLVDPHDVASIGAGVAAIDRDPALRDRLAALGRDRAHHFALAPYARRLLALYGMT